MPHFFALNTVSVFIQKRAVIAVFGADSRVSWALMGEQRKERSTSLPNNELAIQVRPVNAHKRFWQFPKLPATAKVNCLVKRRNFEGTWCKVIYDCHIVYDFVKKINFFKYDFFS